MREPEDRRVGGTSGGTGAGYSSTCVGGSSRTHTSVPPREAGAGGNPYPLRHQRAQARRAWGGMVWLGSWGAIPRREPLGALFARRRKQGFTHECLRLQERLKSPFALPPPRRHWFAFALSQSVMAPSEGPSRLRRGPAPESPTGRKTGSSRAGQ